MDVITRSALLLALLAALVPMTSSRGTRAHPTQWQVPASHHGPGGSRPGDFPPPDDSLSGLPLRHGSASQDASPTLAEELDACDTCEAMPSSGGTSSRRSGAMWLDLPRGEAGEYHQDVVSSDS